MMLSCLAICLIAACSAEKSKKSDATSEVPSVSDFANQRIAILTGSNFSEIVAEDLPEAEQIFFNTVPDMVVALKNNKVDAIALDEPVARSVMAEQGGVTIADGYMDEFDFAIIFPKTDEGKKLCDELSEVMVKMKEDGTMEEMQEKWFDNVIDESMMTIDPNSLPATNGTLRVAAIQYPPFCLLGENTFYGYEPDILTIFGKEKGYRLEFVEMNADAVVPALFSAKCDVATAASSVTEERKESMYFSEPEYSGGVVLLVRGDSSEIASLTDKIKESFEKTFIRENRYKLFLMGIATTVLIVLLSAFFGTLLGFFIFMSCRHNNPIANGVARAFNWLMSGMPMVVLLMILYYIIFSNVPISGTVVAIVGFTMTFGAEIYGMIKTAVGAVDDGQMEAAYALGYTDTKAFYKHILPQAMPHFMPAFRGSLVSLVKSTSIVGYIAVQDLTKAGDLVRSSTYDAFFPLIAIAIIYFILAGIMIYIVNRVTLKFDPERRNEDDILKGVEIHD